MNFSFDCYGATLNEGDVVLPVSGEHLLLYNSIEEYIKENCVSKKVPELVISKVYEDGTIDISYKNSGLKNIEVLSQFFVCNADSKFYTKKEYFEEQEKLHKYVVSGGRHVIADNLIDTGYLDCYGEVIYHTSVLKKAHTFDCNDLYLMMRNEETGEFEIVKKSQTKSFLNPEILNVLEVFYTEEIK